MQTVVAGRHSLDDDRLVRGDGHNALLLALGVRGFGFAGFLDGLFDLRRRGAFAWRFRPGAEAGEGGKESPGS